MSSENLEGLFVEASGNEGVLPKLTETVEKTASLEKANVSAGVELLLETWGQDAGASEARAKFCLLLAEKSCPDSPLLRNSLGEALKKLSPPFMNKPGFMRALGLRDAAVPPLEISTRFRTMLKLRNGVAVFQTDSRRWGLVSKVDEFTSSVGLNALSGGSSWAAPLPPLLSRSLIFEAHPELVKFASAGKKELPPPVKCRDILLKHLLAGADEKTLGPAVALMLVPERMSQGEFADWWAKCAVADGPSVAKAPGERKAFEARSVQEFRTILAKIEDDDGFVFGPEESAALAEFLKNLDSAKIKRDEFLFAEALSVVGRHMTPENFNKALPGLAGKCGFLPESPSKSNAGELVVWGDLAARHLPKLVEAAVFLQGEEYMSELALDLPIRCINAVADVVGKERIFDAIPYAITHGADLLLWMWKNKAVMKNKEAAAFLNLENVLKAAGAQGMPKTWQASQRELRRLLFEKADFQKAMMSGVSDVASIIPCLQKSRAFQAGEQQSLLVKLSGHSPALREYIEKGDGRNLIGASSQQAARAPTQPPMTSHASYGTRVRELEELVNKHVPENQEALKIARSYGDFRENAEYDAAKERRNYLSKRRAELEHDLSFVQRTTFKDLKIDDHAALGASVTVRAASGSSETFHLVGYWDGDPDNSLVSYRSKLGESLVGLKKGDKAKLPDGTECEVSDVRPLSGDLAAKLDHEL